MIAKPLSFSRPEFILERNSPTVFTLRREDLSAELTARFVQGFLQALSETKTSSEGAGISRGRVQIISGKGGDEYVLRLLRRGGRMRLLSTNTYFLLWGRTRVESEVLILEHLLQQGVSVCKPVCALYQRVFTILPAFSRCFCYRAALVCERIAASRSIIEAVRQPGVISPEELSAYCRQAGEEARRKLNAGVFHSDLHLGNVLVDKEGKVVLIDFDKALRFPAAARDYYQKRTLERWERALRKHAPELLKCCGSSFAKGLLEGKE